MKTHLMKTRLLAVMVLALSGCAAAEPDEEIVESEEALTTIDVAPALQAEFTKIKNTATGGSVVARARARGLRTIKVGPLAGNIVGLYTSNGVITIQSPNDVYTFQRLAHELLHAAGYKPHLFPDKGLIGKMCAQANANCPSWN